MKTTITSMAMHFAYMAGNTLDDHIIYGGLQSLGWVEQAACRPYTPSAADSALVSVMPEVAAGGYSPGEDSASHAVCARALKLAAQYQTVNDVQQARLPVCMTLVGLHIHMQVRVRL